MTDFWREKRVLITGHTGFKGSWLSLWLTQLGAKVTGLSLEPESAFFPSLRLEGEITHLIGDIRDPETVERAVVASNPDVVFHMAAQSLVLRGYEKPVETWNTNVMGSLNLMQALRNLNELCAVVMVATDKVYANDERAHPFRETDPLGGYDPYSSSKAAMEIAVDSWRKSYFLGSNIRMASARAGNVIGGGDWAENRIVPDIARALEAGIPIEVRNPNAVRPWQHVLEPLRGYMTLAEKLFISDEQQFQAAFNFGPSSSGVRSVRDVVKTALSVWPGTWNDVSGTVAAHEAGVLTLATDKAEEVLNHHPRWTFEQGVRETMNWYRAVSDGSGARETTLDQLQSYGAS